MRRWLWLLVLLMATQAKATVLAGSFKYPDGSAVNGTLYISLEKNGLTNTCVGTPIVVPTAPVIIPVVNGVLTGSPNIVPTDCLSTWQPYLVILRNTVRLPIVQTHWYITQASGAQEVPTIGSFKIYPTGLTYSVTGTDGSFGLPTSYTVTSQPLAGYQTMSFSIAAATGSTTGTATYSWPKKFTQSPTIVCSGLDSAAYASGRVGITNFTVNTDYSISAVVTYNTTGGSLTVVVYCRGWQ